MSQTTRLIAHDQIQRFVSRHDADRSLERVLAQSVPWGDLLTHLQKARSQQLIKDMADIRYEHLMVATHTVMRTNPEFATSLSMVGTLENLIVSKRTKIIQYAGARIADEAPAYFRSHQFNTQQFGELAIGRSFTEQDLYEKWVRLSVTVRTVRVRLQLLHTLLDGIRDLMLTAQEFESDESVERAMKASTTKLLDQLIEIS